MKNRTDFLLLLAGIALTVIIASCSNNAQNEYLIPEKVYGEAIAIKGEYLPTEYMSKSTPKGYFTPHGIWGFARMEENSKYIHMINPESGEIIASALTKGRGPNEMIAPKDYDYSAATDRFYVSDLMNNFIMDFKFENDSIIPVNKYDFNGKDPAFFANFACAPNNTFVLFLNRKTTNLLFLVDANNNRLDSLYYMPFKNDQIDTVKFGQMYFITMATSPDDKTLFVSDNTYNSLKKYSLQNNKLTLVKEKMNLEPQVDIIAGELKLKPEHIMAHGAIRATDKYLFMVSRPHKFGETEEERAGRDSEGSYILVFDYDLNFVKSYVCDSNFGSMTVAPDGKTIYASGDDRVSLKKYVLEDLE